MRRLYASKLTKEDLMNDGITNITTDGHVFKGDKEVFPFWIPSKRPYLVLMIYERDEDGHLIPGKDRICRYKKADGSIGEYTSWQAKQRTLGLHRVMWAWHYGEAPEGMVVDHIDNRHETLYDYRLENLQLLTPSENLAKEKTDSDTRLLKCNMKKPRSFFEEKLLKYEEKYEKAKKEHNAEDAHKFRTCISQTRARIRYWDEHQKEYEEAMEELKKNEEELRQWKQNVKDRKLLAEYRDMFRKAGNKTMWRQMIKIIKAWDALDSIQKEHIFDCLHKFF